MSKQLSGKDVVKAINKASKKGIEELASKGVQACLAVVRVGEKGDDIAYERSLIKRCESIGVAVKLCTYAEDVEQETLAQEIVNINEDKDIHACLIFRPMPSHINDEIICNTLSASKDVDGITLASMAKVYSGRGEGYAPCTAQACIETLAHYKISLKGKNVVVIGRSLVIGKPVAMMLLKENATVTVCHTSTKGMKKICRKADIIVAAAGSAGMVDSSYVSEDQVVIDVGINIDENGKLCGDVKPAVQALVAAYSPVPGGVGTVTTAVLIKHVVMAALRSQKG